MHAEATSQLQVWSPSSVTVILFFNDRVSLPSRRDWLTRDHQGAARLCLPVLGLHVHAEIARFLKIIDLFFQKYIYIYIICIYMQGIWSHLLSLTPLTFPRSDLTTMPFIPSFFFLYYPRNPSRVAHLHLGVSHSLELGQLRTGHALKRNDSPIFTSYQLPITPPGLGPPELFHHPHWDVTWHGRVQAAAATVSSWVQWSCRVRKTHLYSSPNLWFLQFLQSFCLSPIWSSLSLGGRRWYR